MFKVLFSLLNHFIFTVSFILGVQLPEFIQQYIQRLSGHLTEITFQLQQFQTIADSQFNGDLAVMIKRYQMNSDSAIAQTGNVIGAMVERLKNFEQQLNRLQDSDYINQLINFVFELNVTMAEATLENFQLAIPLTLKAITSGVIFAVVILLLQTGLAVTVKATAKAIRRNLSINKAQVSPALKPD